MTLLHGCALGERSSGCIWKFRTSSFKCHVDHPHTIYSSANTDVWNWVHLFESPCISNKMQRYTVYYIWKLLYMFRSNGVTNTRYCSYSCMRSWWWVEVLPETCRAVSRYNKLCNVASCWIYIGIFLRCMDPWTLKMFNSIIWRYRI